MSVANWHKYPKDVFWFSEISIEEFLECDLNPYKYFPIPVWLIYANFNLLIIVYLGEMECVGTEKKTIFVCCDVPEIGRDRWEKMRCLKLKVACLRDNLMYTKEM